MCLDKMYAKQFECNDSEDIFDRYERVYVDQNTMKVYDDNQNLKQLS